MVLFSGLGPILSSWLEIGMPGRRIGYGLGTLALGTIFLSLIWTGFRDSRIPIFNVSWDRGEPNFKGTVAVYLVFAALSFWAGGFLLMNALFL